MKRLLYIFIALFIFSSCEDEIDIEHPVGSTKIVVEGEFTTTNKVQTVKLSTTAPSQTSGETPAINDASVAVITSDGVRIDYALTSNGVYSTNSPVAAEIGKSYYVEIILANGDTIFSEPETVVAAPEVDSLYFANVNDYEYVEGPPRPIDDEETGYYVFMDMLETPGLGNAYLWKAYIDGVELTAPEEIFIESDVSIFSDFFNENEDTYQEQLDFNFLAPLGSDVKMEVYAISQKHYEFLLTLYINTVEVGTPFSTPPSAPRGNLYYQKDPKGELVLGYFAAMDYNSDSVTIIGTKE